MHTVYIKVIIKNLLSKQNVQVSLTCDLRGAAGTIEKHEDNFQTFA